MISGFLGLVGTRIYGMYWLIYRLLMLFSFILGILFGSRLMAHGREGPARPLGPEGAPGPDPGQGPGALLRAPGAGPAPLGHEP